ncbi:MAG TPA: MgtC/SapB family protein [Nocardioides sp.]|nr:MgtC/SapB family protein [Nocardioides sp.]
MPRRSRAPPPKRRPRAAGCGTTPTSASPTASTTTQILELLLAFGLSALVGLEREVHGKSAGVRTQTIVGTSSALILLVSKYGFQDVLGRDVVLDPSRVAAQIVSGVGFLGAGLIITRQGAIRGLTTAAAVWETAAIGMAAGAGLWELAVTVTVLHFVIVIGFTAVVIRLPARIGGSVRLHLVYADSQGVLRQVLNECSTHGWSLTAMAADPPGSDRILGQSLSPADGDHVGVMFTLSGRGVHRATNVLAGMEGVRAIDRVDEEAE